MTRKETVITQVVSSGYCAGCGMCAGICPQRCLQMRFNAVGEYNPFVIETSCTQCGLCLKACPFADDTNDEEAIAADRFGTTEGINYSTEVGYYQDVLAGYSDIACHREMGASGGLGTWLLESLITSGRVDAVACVGPLEGGHPFFAYRLCHTAEEIRACSKSAYYPVELSGIIRTILDNEGRYAIIGLPCVCKALRLASGHLPQLARRVKYVLGLTCGHGVSSYFAEYVCGLAGGKPTELYSVAFRQKEPGTPTSDSVTKVICKGPDGEKTRMIKWSQNVGVAFINRLFVPLSCDFCDDVFAECSDAVFMDAWLPAYSGDWRGHSIMVIRDGRLAEINNTGASLHPLGIAQATKSQEHVLKMKRQYLSARIQLGRETMVRIPKKRYWKATRRLSFGERILVSAQWQMARSSGSIWVQTHGNTDLFLRATKPIISRLNRGDRLASLLDDPVRTVRKWIGKAIERIVGRLKSLSSAARNHGRT